MHTLSVGTADEHIQTQSSSSAQELSKKEHDNSSESATSFIKRGRARTFSSDSSASASYSRQEASSASAREHVHTFIEDHAAPLVTTLSLEVSLLAKKLQWDKATQEKTQELLHNFSVDNSDHTVTALVSLVHLWAGQVHFYVRRQMYAEQPANPYEGGDEMYTFHNLLDSFSMLCR